MQYKSYEKDIVLHYGIELVGWTEGLPFACPSSLPTTLEPLQKLLQAIDDGYCYFRRLSSAERGRRREEYNRSVTDGAVAPRRARKDKGKKRGTYRRRKGADVGPDGDHNGNGDGDGDGDGDGEETDEEDVRRHKKRTRTSRERTVSSSESDD